MNRWTMAALNLSLLLGACALGNDAFADTKNSSATKAPATKSAATDKWQQHTMEEMTISLPPDSKSYPGNALISHYWMGMKDDVFLVMVVVLPDVVKDEKTGDKLLDNANTWMLKSMSDAELFSGGPAAEKGKIAIKSVRPVTLNGHAGKEWEEAFDGVPVTMRIVLGKKHFYAVSSVGADAAGKKKFFDSMTLK